MIIVLLTAVRRFYARICHVLNRVFLCDTTFRCKFVVGDSPNKGLAPYDTVDRVTCYSLYRKTILT